MNFLFCMTISGVYREWSEKGKDDRRLEKCCLVWWMPLLLWNSHGRVPWMFILHESMHLFSLPMVMAGGGGVMMSVHFGDVSIVSDHVHPFISIVYPSSNGCFKQDAMSQTLNHLKVVLWTGDCGGRTVSCLWKPRLASWICSRQICTVNKTIFQRNVSTPSWIYATTNQDNSEGRSPTT